MAQKIFVILGPTASGKTSLGIELAQENNGAVISADSRQIYAGLNIGTAKPKQAWKEESHSIDKPDVIDSIDHYLLNIRSPKETYTASDWQRDANVCIKQILAQNKQPIIVGGTMLYIDSIVFNFTMPAVSPNPALRQQLDSLSTEELQQRLQEKDPAVFNFIELHHRQRMIRALEVIEATGKKFSELRTKQPSPYEFEIIGLFPGWETLENRVTDRIHDMLADGLSDEVKALREKYGRELPLLKTINYAETARFIDNELTEADAMAEMIRANMRYAHRQMSWWKRNKDIKWFESATQALPTFSSTNP